MKKTGRVIFFSALGIVLSVCLFVSTLYLTNSYINSSCNLVLTPEDKTLFAIVAVIAVVLCVLTVFVIFAFWKMVTKFNKLEMEYEEIKEQNHSMLKQLNKNHDSVMNMLEDNDESHRLTQVMLVNSNGE